MSEQNPEGERNVIQIEMPNIQDSEAYEKWVKENLGSGYDKSYDGVMVDTSAGKRLLTDEEKTRRTAEQFIQTAQDFIAMAKGNPSKINQFNNVIRQSLQDIVDPDKKP